ncbi:NADH dehydrogenase (quinone) [Solidesulfovibrio carbinoliphilus subsp. oakridgensis]|uniref:NADH-quinone oxidoreductase subunit D n=1 Tax=Solidesulfovibrio carbinoliphilus subsp. oakridgensis TaxID=694327 RepID=G7QBU5_9BACT|nr:NADH-quinone oxidoreductase subunit D [Solidesulfovibrio carbinoliphilus]EHJ49438.1 NADH dehydrogenase (quinone) [Solidesulfovibrio carbinoliphilus subsp. oakridgensis]
MQAFDPTALRGDLASMRFEPGPTDDKLILSMGPQHPSTHGVLRIMLELDGEYILRAEPILGYVHRMHEWMAEQKTYMQFMPNMGRVDYLHAMAWNWAYAGAVERLLGVQVPERAEYIRVAVTELNRISSHLLWWGAYLLDLGAFTPIMYAFDDRERILDILQDVTGSRLTYSYFTFGGVYGDVPSDFASRCLEFTRHLRSRLPMYRDLVTDNVILRGRCEGIGEMNVELARKYGATGPVLRGSGAPVDTRRAEPYGVYNRFDFRIPAYNEGDAMARYMVRMDELTTSCDIIDQAVQGLPEGPIQAKVGKTVKPPKGEACYAVEGARGKILVHVRSDGGPKPYRVKLRAPGFSNLSLFSELSRGTLLADAVSILGSLDLVIPEIDR